VVSEKFKKTLEMLFIAVIIIIIIVFLIQNYGSNKLNQKCSYLDPILIDVLAFFVAFFLIVEGFYQILKNKRDSYKNQFLRISRIAIGFAILTIHTMQFLHK